MYFLPLRPEGAGTPWGFLGGCRSPGSVNGIHAAGLCGVWSPSPKGTVI